MTMENTALFTNNIQIYYYYCAYICSLFGNIIRLQINNTFLLFFLLETL